jgi:Flp pilus assembly protein TadD
MQVSRKNNSVRPQDSILFDEIYLLGIIMLTWFLFRLSFITYVLLFWNVCVPSTLLDTRLEFFGIYWPVIAMDAFVLAWVGAFVARNAREWRTSPGRWLVPLAMAAFVIYNLSMLPTLVEWRAIQHDPGAVYEFMWKEKYPDRPLVHLRPGGMISSRWQPCVGVENARFSHTVMEEKNSLEQLFWTEYSRRSSDGMKNALYVADVLQRRKPDEGEAWAMKALVYGNAVDFGVVPAREAGISSRRALEKALFHAPQSPVTDAAYGLLMRQRDTATAEARLRRCIANEPDFPECHNLLGDLLRKTDRAEQAGSVYQEGLSRWPENGELHVSYALYLQETGRVEQALESLRKLVTEQPHYSRAHWHLAVMLYEEGRSDEAREHAVRALELDPEIWNGELLLLELLKPD